MSTHLHSSVGPGGPHARAGKAGSDGLPFFYDILDRQGKQLAGLCTRSILNKYPSKAPELHLEEKQIRTQCIDLSL